MALNQAQATQIENESLALGARADRITAQINDYVATVNTNADPASTYVTDGQALEAEAIDTLAELNQFYNNPTVLEGRSDETYRAQVNDAVDTVRSSRDQTTVALQDLRSTLDTLGTEAPPEESGTNSAGQIIGSDADNRTEFATTQNPGTSPDQGDLAIETPSNADGVTTRGLADFTDQETNALTDDSGLQAPTIPTATTGVDGIQVNQGYNQVIRPKENLLSRFGTSTYSVTIYMITPGQYNTMMGYSEDANATFDEGGQAIKSVEGFQAILASGGLPPGGTDILTGDPYTTGGAIRNRFFDLDYFIDDIEIETLQPQQVRGATNVTSLSFKITEPYGFTFINRLKSASQEIQGSFQGQDWIRQHYLMVIRFYGQTDGMDTAPGEDTVGGGNTNGAVVVTSQAPLSEKYIPFKFTNITTRAATGAVEYVCSAVPINHMEAMSIKNSSAKYQVEVKGQTLEEIFNGKLNQTGNTLTSGLMESINAYYTELSKNGVIGPIPPQFRVNFRGGIGDQKVVPPGSTKKNRTAMADPTFPTLLDSSRNSMQKNTINFSINAGTQLQQILDLIIRASEWVTKQQKKYIDPNTRKVVEKSSNNLLQWYRITSSVKILGWDEIRQDYAYQVTYDVLPSAVSDVKSGFFPKKRFNGTQKRYKYWFTGENTEVLDYEVDFNALYYVSSSPYLAQEKAPVGTVGEMSNPGPADQSVHGGSDLSSDPAARAASVLYSPTDYALLSMKILGDPFYIQQGDIFWRSLGVDDNDPGFLADGSADFDSGEVLIEVDYNTMEDYDEFTGLADVRPIELKSEEEIANTTATDGTVYKGLIYQVTQVTNNFSKGVFTQNLQGVLKQYVGDYEGVPNTPITRPTNSVVTNGPTSSSTVNTTPTPITTITQSSTSKTGPTTITPVLGGLTLSGASYQAPDDDAS